MFNNSKYSNVLTVILIITIIAILATVGIVIYRIYKAHNIDSGAIAAANEFEDAVANNNGNNGNNVSSDKNIAGVEDAFVDQYGSSTSGKKTKYKGFDVVGTIQIPKISLKYPILAKVTKKSLETSVALLYTSKGLNEVGDSVIIGHNYRNGTMFSRVKNLENGNIIYITDTLGRKVKYTVYKIYRTSGSDGSYITRNTNGKREISLSTCTDDSKARTIVLARED